MKQYTFLLILLVTEASLATTWTVDDDGKADFSDIQSAINAASDGDEIIIMPGTYTGAGDQVVDTLGKAITLRGQSVDSTIINGENVRRGITCRSTSQSNVVIENLWIQNCLAENGGGLWMEGNPEVKTCWIMNNNAISAGGNVYVLSGNPVFSAGCNFNNGTAPYGAGVYCKDGSPEFDSCFFLSNNASERGGAIRGYQISGYFSNCSFSNNTASRGGAGHFQANLNGLSSTFDTCYFQNNTASSLGGGVVNNSTTDSLFQSCYFVNNTATGLNGGQGSGGGLYNDSSNPQLLSCIFESNTANSNGGGIYNWSSTPQVQDCQFLNNSAATGGGIRSINGTGPSITSSTFCENMPDNISGVHVDDGTNCLADSCADYDNDGTPDECQFSDVWTVDDDGLDYPGADFISIQDAIDAASNGEEILVFPGTYTSDADEVVDLLGKEIWLHSIAGPEVTIIDGQDQRRGIQCANGETSNTIIEGFTITNGYSALYGGGMYNNYSSPTLTNCAFENNVSADDGGEWNYTPGGGMYNNYSSPTLTNCTFTNNSALEAAGGGMYNAYSSPMLTDCAFTGNNADVAGGMCNSDSNTTLTNCIFNNNTATNAGGGMYNWECSPILIDCSFMNNTATDGCGMFNWESSPSLANCAFDNNEAFAQGGGMYNYSSSSNPTLTDCTFTNNTASLYGGGMHNYTESSPTLIRCTFTNNTAHQGGGMDNSWYSNPSLTDCIFTNNTADQGGGMYNWGYSNPTLTDCTLTSNTSDYGNGVLNFRASTNFFGTNTSDELLISSISSLAFSAESTCDVTGSTVLSSEGTISFDIDAINTSSSLNVSESIDLLGGLVVSNNSTSLLAANVGDIIPLAQASTLVGNFDSIVFPLMPEGLGLQLIDYPALRGGGSEVAAEVIEVEGAEFANPFSGGLDSPPVDIISFDADGDGRDEMAVLFEGTPGGVVGYSVSQDGLPTPIDGLVVNVGNNPVSIDAADINSDGREDLIVANSTDNSISVLLTMVDIDGSLYFDVFAISVPGSGQSITCVAAIDLDGDTDLDAVVGVDGVNTGYQVLLDLSGAMTNGSWFAIPDYQLPNDIYVPDPPTCVDGGDQTSAWGFVGGTRYGRIHRGTSSGALQVIDELEGNNTVTIEAIELDEGGGDGQIDLMVSSDEAESIYLFKGNAAESDGFDNLIPLGVSSSVEDLVALDVDDDGDMDMVMTAPTSDTPLVLLRNDGGGIELVGGLSGITWSKQAVDSGNPPRNVSSGTLGGKDEDDDWIVGAGGNAGLIGTETSTLSQINIASNSSCPCDLNSDGAVSVNDLLLLIADWGACSNCEADFDNNNAVDVLDLLVLIAAWGPCS